MSEPSAEDAPLVRILEVVTRLVPSEPIPARYAQSLVAEIRRLIVEVERQRALLREFAAFVSNTTYDDERFAQLSALLTKLKGESA